MWKFELNQSVKIMASSEHGEVIGRAEYAHCENCYLLRYKAGDGRAVESWWTESAIENGRVEEISQATHAYIYPKDHTS